MQRVEKDSVCCVSATARAAESRYLFWDFRAVKRACFFGETKMKKIAAAFAVLALSAIGASAADLAVKARPAPIAALPSWTGFYLGVNGGGAGTTNDPMTYTDLANVGNTSNAYAPTTVNASASGAIAGFHAGYNWQAAPKWVLGIEGDWDWTHLSAGGVNRLNQAITGVLLSDNASLETKVNSLASLRGRLGYVWNNQWLFYATGGVGFADMNFHAAVNCTGIALTFCGGPPQSILTQFSDTRIGAVFGAGIEFKPASHWTFGAEYLHYDFHDTNAGGSWFVVATGAPAPFFACTVAGQNCANFSFGNFGVNTGRLRLSYQLQP
jgi:outer membrane immunogenic protein